MLAVSGVVRSDIRSSFISSTSTVSGVLLTLTLKLVQSASGCTPISGAAIYIWHCGPSGLYSLYSSGATTESWLRGVQITDANGEVTFTTIYPGCYQGRWPHIHFEVFTGGLTSSSTGRTSQLISQIAMPPAINTAVYGTSAYSSSVSPYSNITLSSDNVFGDNTSAQMAQQTASLSGSTSAGYSGTVVIGL